MPLNRWASSLFTPRTCDWYNTSADSSKQILLKKSCFLRHLTVIQRTTFCRVTASHDRSSIGTNCGTRFQQFYFKKLKMKALFSSRSLLMEPYISKLINMNCIWRFSTINRIFLSILTCLILSATLLDIDIDLYMSFSMATVWHRTARSMTFYPERGGHSFNFYFTRSVPTTLYDHRKLRFVTVISKQGKAPVFLFLLYSITVWCSSCTESMQITGTELTVSCPMNTCIKLIISPKCTT